MNVNKKSWGLIGIIAGSVIGVIVIFAAIVASTNNSAIQYEQTVGEQQSGIQVQIQRRHDLILSLVSAVEASGKFESSTLTSVIQMRQNAKSGNVDQAMLNLNAVAEAYPDIKTVANYTQLMTELSTTENLISEQRKTYNGAVRSYLSYVRSFPTGAFLSLAGYQKQNYAYLNLDTPSYDPNIFPSK